MARRHRDDELFDYDSASTEELARLMADGIVDIEPAFDAPVIFDPQFQRRAEELNRKPFAGAKPVNIVRLKQGPWTGNPQLGIQQDFAPNSNNEQTILKMDEWGMPQRWQVTLGMTFEDELGAGVFDVTALINFGAGGVTQTLEVDWENGVSFPLTFNSVNIIARYGNATVFPNDLKLRAHLGLYSGGPNTGARQHTAFSVGNGGGQQIIRIPFFARRFRVVSTTAAAPTDVFDAAVAYRTFFDLSGTVLGQSLNGTQMAGLLEAGIPIVSGSRYLEIRNSSASAINGHVIWDMST